MLNGSLWLKNIELYGKYIRFGFSIPTLSLYSYNSGNGYNYILVIGSEQTVERELNGFNQEIDAHLQCDYRPYIDACWRNGG